VATFTVIFWNENVPLAVYLDDDGARPSNMDPMLASLELSVCKSK
jgi:hypothetical protein